MNYKVGDKVVIKDDIRVGSVYGHYTFVPSMQRYCGGIATITDVRSDSYKIDLETASGWTDEMLEPYQPYKGGKAMDHNLIEEPKHECVNCHGIQKESTMRQDHNDDWYCEMCQDSLRECCECQDIFDDQNEGTVTQDGYNYCDDCQDGHTWCCEDCEDTYSEHTDHISAEGGDRIICEDCYNDHYFTCEHCERVEHNDNRHHCDDCDTDLCESCSDDHDCSEESDDENDSDDTGRSRRFSTRNPSGTYHGDKRGKYLTVDRLVGVEIEAEKGYAGEAEDLVPQECGMSGDGSLDRTGVEVQTPPASMNKAEDIIKRACKGLEDAGFEPTSACGLHVHIDATGIRTAGLINIYRTMYAIEDVLFSMLPPSRWDNHYCQSFRKNYSFEELHKAMTKEQVEETWYKDHSKSNRENRKQRKYDGTRYSAMNIHSYYYKGTIEFRQHSGTINPDKICKWAHILLKAMDYGLNRYNEKTIEKLVYTQVSKEKLDRVVRLLKIAPSVAHYMNARIMEHNKRFKPIIGQPKAWTINIMTHVNDLLYDCKNEAEWCEAVRKWKPYIRDLSNVKTPSFITSNTYRELKLYYMTNEQKEMYRRSERERQQADRYYEPHFSGGLSTMMRETIISEPVSHEWITSPTPAEGTTLTEQALGEIINQQMNAIEGMERPQQADEQIPAPAREVPQEIREAIQTVERLNESRHEHTITNSITT